MKTKKKKASSASPTKRQPPKKREVAKGSSQPKGNYYAQITDEKTGVERKAQFQYVEDRDVWFLAWGIRDALETKDKKYLRECITLLKKIPVLH